MPVSLVMLIVYMVVTLGVSFFVSHRKKKTLENESGTSGFMVAGGGLGTVMVMTLLFGELIAGAGTLGNAASGFKSGVSSVWANWGMTIGAVLFVLLTLKFYRAMKKKFNTVSVAEAYKFLFDERCRMVLLVVVVLVYGILFSMQPKAAANIIASMIGVDPTIVTWIICGVFILLTVTGGMKGIAGVNLVHAIVMFAGLFVISIKSVGLAGGMEHIKSVLPSTYFSFFQPNVGTTIANALGTGISMLAAATFVSVTFSAKSEGVAKRGALIAGFAVVPFALAVSFIGISAKVVLPGIDSNSALFLMASQLGEIFSGLAAMAIIAAIWSTGPALLLVVSTTLTKDLYGKLRPEATDKQQLAFSKIMVVVVGVVATALSFKADGLLDQMYGAFQIRSIVGIVLVVALFWPKMTKDAAFWSMLIGGIVAAVWFFAGSPFGVSALWPAAAVTIIVLVVVTMRSKDPVSESYRIYKDAMKALKDK